MLKDYTYKKKAGCFLLQLHNHLKPPIIWLQNTYLIIQNPHLINCKKKNILRLFNFAKLEKFWGKKIGKYFHPQKIGLNVITESCRIGKPITMYLYLLLGGSAGRVEDEVPEGEAVALVCLRDKDCLRSGPSGNHGAYESLVTVTLLKEKKNFRQNFKTMHYRYCWCMHSLWKKMNNLNWYVKTWRLILHFLSFCTYTVTKTDITYCTKNIRTQWSYLIYVWSCQ